MPALNANLPYVECFVREKYIKSDGTGVMPGYIFGVKAMINRPMHFHFLSSIGAIFWQLPISAFCHKEEYDALSDNEQIRLQLLQKNIQKMKVNHITQSTTKKTTKDTSNIKN